MTVRELITQLLDCDMDKDVYIEDEISFKEEHGVTIDGSIYDIERIYDYGYVGLIFNNRNHKLSILFEENKNEPC